MQDYSQVKGLLAQAESMGLNGEEVKQAQAMRLRIEVGWVGKSTTRDTCSRLSYTPTNVQPYPNPNPPLARSFGPGLGWVGRPSVLAEPRIVSHEAPLGLVAGAGAPRRSFIEGWGGCFDSLVGGYSQVLACVCSSASSPHALLACAGERRKTEGRTVEKG